MEKCEFCYSWYGEMYYGQYESEQEALNEAKKERKDAKQVYIGTCTEPILRWSSNEEDIIESISENLGEDVGEAAENFEITIEQERELARMIDETVEAWIKQEKIKPSCYQVLDGHIVALN